MSDETIRTGVIGCGSFALFALQQFSQVPGVKLVGMSGTHRAAAHAAAKRFGMGEVQEVEDMLARIDLDLVYIATPPFLHHPQAMQALQAGKHVICEKPLALTVEQADEMLETARERDLLVVADLMQRYNPLYEMVRDLIQSEVLGRPLHGYFENYAADEGLHADHWFWDREKSGGIFVEHGVHFFDLFEGWLGEGQVESAQRSVRPGEGLEDQVQCAVRYQDTILVNFYHGFHQPGRMDRQELRIVFERGSLTLEGWIPTKASIHAVVDEGQTRRLGELFPDATVDATEIYAGKDRTCRGRGKELDVYQKIDLTWGQGLNKMKRYGELLRAFMRDQLSWTGDREHRRTVTGENGRRALRLACQADHRAASSLSV